MVEKIREEDEKWVIKQGEGIFIYLFLSPLLSLSCCLPGFSSIPASRVGKQVIWIQPGTYTSTYLLVDVHYLTFYSGHRKLIHFYVGEFAWCFLFCSHFFRRKSNLHESHEYAARLRSAKQNLI